MQILFSWSCHFICYFILCTGASRQPPSNLADIVTSDAILNSGVLEDPEVRAQLIALLPEGMNRSLDACCLSLL